MLPTVVAEADAVVVFLAPPAPGVLLGVSASEPRLSSIAVIGAGAADDGPVVDAGEAVVAESRPPFLFLR